MNSSESNYTLKSFWDGKEYILTEVSSFLLLADNLLLFTFVYKIYYQKNIKVFGNEKTARSVLDRMFLTLFTLLATQGVFCVIMSLNYMTPPSGFKCSAQNFVFTWLHTVLKAISCSIIFQFHYIWIKQRALRFLHSFSPVQKYVKFIFVFVVSFCVLIPFKANIDIVFIVKYGSCFAKRLRIHHTLVKISLVCALLVIFNLFLVQIYYIYKTRKAKYEYRLKCSIGTSYSTLSASDADIVFGLIRNQIVLFSKFLSVFFVHLLLHFLFITSLGYIPNFSVLHYIVRHLYSFLYCLVLCIYRFIVPKLSLKEQYLQLRKT